MLFTLERVTNVRCTLKREQHTAPDLSYSPFHTHSRVLLLDSNQPSIYPSLSLRAASLMERSLATAVDSSLMQRLAKQPKPQSGLRKICSGFQ